MDNKTRKTIEQFQKTETTEHYVYKKLAATIKGENRKILEKIADDEEKHAKIWQKYTGKNTKPSKLKAFFYIILAKLISFTFAIKLMEKNEEKAEKAYKTIIEEIPEAKTIMQEENQHEEQLTAMLDEERLDYIGSMVLGINDALVELTGALAGLSFALQNTSLIGLTGLITGISASLSMAASEYLSTRSEKTGKSPIKAALYTGSIYLMTVILLVLPYFLFESYMTALAVTLATAILIILIFTFFISIVKEEKLIKLFLEMTLVSLGVAIASFGIGILARTLFNIEIQ
ncbi:VIT1/CCC1 transporter family protein [Spirochaetia bacterium 38H-sp]|uniref:VIT1/CCC1 transporter family protein n=1 Tax=Rarispira pelagica TaxID=3141764 RepID=A0ABU9UCF5_9SPIR